LDRHKSK